MVAPGQTVLVAFSGGPDSTALLHALRRLKDRLKIRVAACHVHHGLRGAEADADAAHAGAFAQSLKVPFVEKRADVSAVAEGRKLSVEAAAREVRYALLDEAADEVAAERIATGHTADDQAETVLLNLLRGAGPGGLAGIPPVRGRIIRPLLNIARAEVESYCQVQGLTYRTDASNLDLQFTRNRIRHQVMPLLREVQPNAAGALCRLAEIMRGEDEVLESLSQSLLARISSDLDDGVAVELLSLMPLPIGMRRRVLKEAVAWVKGENLDIPLERIEALSELAMSGRTGAVVEAGGGVRAERGYDALTIRRGRRAHPGPGRERELAVPGFVIVPEARVILQARAARRQKPPKDARIALLDADTLSPPLLVRFWREGDRFVPLGMSSEVKLHDFFVNRKIPRLERGRVPLVASKGEIVWVVGQRISDRHKITETTRRVARLEARPLDSGR